ncbi:MAG: rhomboid family intramembrane serine protease [Planctomycetota bacterium]
MTTILAVGAIAAFAADVTGRSITHLVLNPALFASQPWALLTTIFPHGGPLHLLFNLYWIWPFGCAIESRLGSARYAVLATACAVVSMGSEVLVGNTAIGLSGVVYGLVFFAYYRGKHDPHFRGLVPDQLRNFFIAWFFICIALTLMNVMRIGNFAHGMGAVAGWAFGHRKRWVAPALVAALVGGLFARPLYAPYDRGNAAFQEGVRLLQDNRDLEAAELYQRFVVDHPSVAEGWWNLSVARDRLGDRERAREARQRAIELDPGVATNR